MCSVLKFYSAANTQSTKQKNQLEKNKYYYGVKAVGGKTLVF